jgi:hypothetical protein
MKNYTFVLFSLACLILMSIIHTNAEKQMKQDTHKLQQMGCIK